MRSGMSGSSTFRRFAQFFVLWAPLVAAGCQDSGDVGEPQEAEDAPTLKESALAIPSGPLYQSPFMAPNNFSSIHMNVYQTDTFSIAGPASAPRQYVQNGLIWPPTQIGGTIAFDLQGLLITVRIGPDPRDLNAGEAQTMVLVDPRTLHVLDQVALPPRPSNNNTVSFSGGGYFYLDNLGRPVLVTVTREIRIYSVQNRRFVLDQSYDLSSAFSDPDDLPNSVLPDPSGNLWFISRQGVVGYVDITSGQVHASNVRNVPGADASETNTKSFAADEAGGIYVVSDFALYRFGVGDGGAPTAVWRTPYDRGYRVKPGQVQQGSGTTPTLFNDRSNNHFVTIADNAEPFLHVNVYRRETGALVAQQAVFHHLPFRNSTENSLIAVDRSVLVENNYGNVNPLSTIGPLTTRPGVARIDFDPDSGKSQVVWENREISIPSVVSQLSTADGLLYTYAKDALGWYFAALDYEDGSLIAKSRVPGLFRGLFGNNFYSGLGVGPDGTAYVGVFGGLVAWRPAGLKPE